MIDVIEQFRAATAVRGLILPDQIEADGKLHRCPVEGKKSSGMAGSYVLHLDEFPAGGFHNWRDGLGWQSWHAQLDRGPIREDRSAWSARFVTIKSQLRADETQRHTEAARRASRLLKFAKPAENIHPYLQRKGINAYGLRQLHGQLVVPVRDVHGTLWSLQFIGVNGDKKFLTGGRKRGCYFAISILRDLLCICEGYATAATVFEATGHATAVAFDAGNLEPVARGLRGKFPDLTIIICADNDMETPGNPGVSNATAAARAIDGLVAIPQVHGVAA